MAIQQIGNVFCSLNLGLIYSVSYSYSPKSGISITIFFVNDTGIYTQPILLPLQKASIRIGNASFSMYPVSSSIELSAGRRVMQVEFIDELFLLDHYVVTLPNRECGQNVFVLGTNVDTRTPATKVSTAIDPIAQQIKDLTQFPDYEYAFNEFLVLLQTRFNVQILAQFDSTVRRGDIVGTFREVLDGWCSLYNLSYFFENSVIKVFDPTQLNITLPSQPLNAIEYKVTQDVRDTYAKTVSNWFQQDGGEYPLSQTSNNNGPLYVRTDTLFPVGHEFNLPQTNVDINQVVASMYGQHFWFLYNYQIGSTSVECGWTTIEEAGLANLSIIQAVQSLNSQAKVVIFDDNRFNERFAMYQRYGQEIAGRYYLSNTNNTLALDQQYSWFDESGGQIFNFTNVDSKSVKLDFLTPTNTGLNTIPSTIVNQYYAGVNYTNNRIAYHDDYAVDWLAAFSYSNNSKPEIRAQENADMTNLVDSTFEQLFSMNQSSSMDFSQLFTVPGLGNSKYMGYIPGPVPQSIIAIFAAFSNKYPYFTPRFESIPIKGISTIDYTSLKASQNEPNSVQIVKGTQGPNVVTNTSVIKTLQKGSYTVYYDKYATCASAASPDTCFGYRFEPNQISSDNQLGVTFTKSANNSYILTRDYGFINNLVNNPLLTTLAQGRTFPTQEVSFILNYFYDVPVNFLTNGLVGMEVSVGDGGITSSYTFSNSILQVPDRKKEAAAFQQQIRNSWIRTYRPQEVIT